MENDIQTVKEIDKKYRFSSAISEPTESREAFYKKVRHFYRTAHKPDDSPGQAGLRSLAEVFADKESRYPYRTKTGKSIEFDLDTPFAFLNELWIESNRQLRTQFKTEMRAIVDGLNQFFDSKSTETQESQTYDFASEIIAFDRLTALLPKKNHKTISASRLSRIKNVISDLNFGLTYLDNNSPTFISIKKTVGLPDPSMFKQASVVDVAEKNAFEVLKETMHARIRSFTHLIKAYRIAKLESENQYEEEVHDEYFDHFSWFRMTEDEKALFHPVYLISNTAFLVEHLSKVSELIVSNYPYKWVSLNDSRMTIAQDEVSWEDASHQYRPELASYVFSHRNCLIFQGGTDDPEILWNGLETTLKSTNPSLVHLLIPSGNEENDLREVRAANVGRYFPKVVFDPTKDRQLNISGNTSPEASWPSVNLEMEIGEGDSENSLDIAFTYADYKAQHVEKVKELMVIPREYDSKDLIPLNKYLDLQEKQLYGKLPFIWLSDEDHQLFKAVVPNVWVVSCQERLDFWNFLQGISGITSPTESPLDLNPEMTSKSDERPSTEQVNLNDSSEQAIAIAAERLIAILLDEENLGIHDETSIPISNESGNSKSFEKTETEAATENKSISKESNDKAWIETENCTSCNECTDKYPHLFQYNDEKQALLTDPAKGKYEELVKAAEKCPAACIHPGLPLDQSEKNLEKLIKRAGKFN